MRLLHIPVDRPSLLRLKEHRKLLYPARFHPTRFASNRTLNTTLWYLKPLELYQTVKPYHINIPASALPPGLQCNEESTPYHNVPMRNLRGHEGAFTLDNSGFQVFGYRGSSIEERRSTQAVNLALKEDEYDDPNIVRQKYYPAVQTFVKQMLGAERVVAFTHDVRSNFPCPRSYTADTTEHQVRRRESAFPALPRGTGKAPQPVQGVHVGKAITVTKFIRLYADWFDTDFTPKWAKQRLNQIFGENEAEKLVTRRTQVLK